MIEGFELTFLTKDWALGFFMALSLKRGRIEMILDNILPMTKDDNDN